MNERQRLERQRKVLALYQQTQSIRRTARQLRMSVNTVRKILRGQDHPRQIPHGKRRPTLLDPYKPLIERLVLEDHLSATLILEELRALGYQGGYSIVKQFVRTIRPHPKRRVTTRLEHLPGAEGQVDWSPYKVMLGGHRTQVHAFSLVLPYSRFMVLRFTLDETLDTLLAMHEEAFAVLGGYVALMTYDNMTTVGRHVGPDDIKLNPRFEAYREERGFDVHLIDPGCPTQHGSVERPFHYVEHNCLARRRRTFDSLEDLQAHARWWCDEVANVRLHGSTRERPVDRFQRERPYLLPLLKQRSQAQGTRLSRLVGDDFCVAVDTNRYSVPPRYAGMPATVLLEADTLQILVQSKVVAVHPVCLDRHQRKTLPEHERDFKRFTRSAKVLEQAFIRLGPVADDYFQGLKLKRGRGAGFHLQRLLKLADRYDSQRVVGAMAHTARYGNYSAEAVARVLTGHTFLPSPSDEAASSDRPESDGTNRDDDQVSLPPERVMRWLEGLVVDVGELDGYDRLIDERTEKDSQLEPRQSRGTGSENSLCPSPDDDDDDAPLR